VQELLRGESKSEEPIVLAVLPLENFSGNQEQEYFADGLTDELIAFSGSRCAGALARF
jgi:TolB-like protein